MVKAWIGSPPKCCDICNKPITDTFYDAKTLFGPWANLDEQCFKIHTSNKLGTGFGQKYVKNPQGIFVKVEG